jgi:hypothetical protein
MLCVREIWTFVWIRLSSPVWFIEPEWSSSVWFYIRRIPLPLSTFFQHSAAPILLLFSKLFLIYPSSFNPEGCNPLRLYLLRFVVCVVYGQSNAIFPPLLFNKFFFRSQTWFSSCFEILSGHLTFRIRLGHRFTDSCSEISIFLVISDVNHPTIGLYIYKLL